MDNKLFSIIVATRNAQEPLKKTLSSLLWQTDSCFEIVLVDCASSDSTIDVALSSGLDFAKVISEPDNGIADAWNKGISYAKGKWVLFLNAGDMLHPEHIKKARIKADLLDENTFIICDVIKFDDKGKIVHKIIASSPTLNKIKRGGIGFAHPGSFTPISAFQHIGKFNNGLSIAIDTDFIIRCFLKDYKFELIESCAYMSIGGVSDVHFKKAMHEYFSCIYEMKLVGKYYVVFMPHFLATFRFFIHLFRLAKPTARLAKHLFISLLNKVEFFLPLSFLRNSFFKLIGFSLSKDCSLGFGLSFYQMGNIVLGKGSVINRDCLLDNRATITIGKNVSIARNVQIYTGGHDPHSPLFEMTCSPVVIHDYAVIFSRATIMPGVTIGRGAVVFACAAVCKDVPPMSIVAGNPGVVIGRRKADPYYEINYSYPAAM